MGKLQGARYKQEDFPCYRYNKNMQSNYLVN